jgi:mono/diheme cytochrome c family protein
MNKLKFEIIRLMVASVVVVGLEFAGAGLACAQAPAAGAPPVPIGHHEYSHACAQCHGRGGKGDGPDGAALSPKPTDLTVLAKNNGGKFPTQKILAVIRDTEPISAHGPHEAPVWGKEFSLRDNVSTGASVPEPSAQVAYRVKQLVEYLKSIQE